MIEFSEKLFLVSNIFCIISQCFIKGLIRVETFRSEVVQKKNPKVSQRVGENVSKIFARDSLKWKHLI